MPKRRKSRVPLHRRAAGAGGALLFGIWDRAAQRPMDFAAILTAAIMSTIIVVNAVFLQSGSRSAPYFTPPVAATGSAAGPMAAGPMAAGPMAAGPMAALPGPSQITGTASAKPVEQMIATRPVAANTIAAQPVSARRDDPIADLIAPQPSPRIMAVQRALSDYGYGQIKPSGVLDDATTQRDRKIRARAQNAGHRARQRSPGQRAHRAGRSSVELEHDPEKWRSVFPKRSCSNK